MSLDTQEQNSLLCEYQSPVKVGIESHGEKYFIKETVIN